MPPMDVRIYWALTKVKARSADGSQNLHGSLFKSDQERRVESDLKRSGSMSLRKFELTLGYIPCGSNDLKVSTSTQCAPLAFL